VELGLAMNTRPPQRSPASLGAPDVRLFPGETDRRDLAWKQRGKDEVIDRNVGISEPRRQFRERRNTKEKK
jgi:hypothetical protein